MTMRSVSYSCSFLFALVVGVASSQPLESSGETIAAAVSTECDASEQEAGSCLNSALNLVQKKGVKLHTHEEKGLSLVDKVDYAPLTEEEWNAAIGEGGVYYKDMHQGGLGDCYFLAAITTIAAVYPEIIRNMFVNGPLATGENPVITTKWLVNGKKTYVAMNPMLPTNAYTYDLFFAKPKGTSYWPALLEKGWAKIFGDYKTIEGGVQRECFKAITQAPVNNYRHTNIKAGKDGFQPKHFWNEMAGAQKKKYIVGAGTGNEPCNSIGLYCGHAYAVLGTFAIKGYPQVVKVYNPHGADKYNGVLKDLNTEWDDGEFWVTFNEYIDNFAYTDIAETIEDAGLSDIVLSATDQKSVALEFEVTDDKPFSVQFEWPMRRFFGEGCPISEPTFVMSVAKKDSPADSELLIKPSLQMSNARATMDGGKGTYQVFVNVDFPYSKKWLKEYVVNVYGAKTELTITEDVAPMDLFMSMRGLCSTILVPGTQKYSTAEAGEYTLDESTLVHGIPVFKPSGTADKSTMANPAYGVLFWDPKRQVNKGTSMFTRGFNGFRISPTVAHAQNGAVYLAFNNIPGAKCKPSSLQEKSFQEKSTEDHGEPIKVVEEAVQDKWQVYNEDGDFQNEAIDLEEDGAHLQENADTTEKQDCGFYALRADTLDNGAEIAKTGEDSMFPDTLKAIARPGQTCGDTATGITASCEKFNSWKSVSEIRTAVKEKKALSAQCAADCSVAKGCTTAFPKGGKAQVDFTMCEGEHNLPLKYKCDGGKFFTIKGANIYNLPDWVLKEECSVETPISQCIASGCKKDGCIKKVMEAGRCKVDFAMCQDSFVYKCSGGRKFPPFTPKRYSLPDWVCSDDECAVE